MKDVIRSVGSLQEKELKLIGNFFLLWSPVVALYVVYTWYTKSTPSDLDAQNYIFAVLSIILALLPFVAGNWLKQYYSWCILGVFLYKTHGFTLFWATQNFSIEYAIIYMLPFVVALLLIQSRVLYVLFGLSTFLHFSIALLSSNTALEVQTTFLFTYVLLYFIMMTITFGNLKYRDAQERILKELGNEMQIRAGMIQDRVADLNRRKKDMEQVKTLLAHDIKQPLFSSYTMLDLLLDTEGESLSDSGVLKIEELKSRVSTLNKMVDGVIKIVTTSMEVKTNKLTNVAVLLPPIVANLPKRQGIDVAIVGNLPKVYCNELDLFQVFQSLLDNALVHNKNKESLTVTIGYKRESGDHLFFVRDNGIGIEKRYFNKIFMPFKHFNDAESQEAAGLGLALVQKIIANYNGAVWVESELGQGSTFFFTLPMLINTSKTVKEL